MHDPSHSSLTCGSVLAPGVAGDMAQLEPSVQGRVLPRILPSPWVHRRTPIGGRAAGAGSTKRLHGPEGSRASRGSPPTCRPPPRDPIRATRVGFKVQVDELWARPGWPRSRYRFLVVNPIQRRRDTHGWTRALNAASKRQENVGGGAWRSRRPSIWLEDNGGVDGPAPGSPLRRAASGRRGDSVRDRFGDPHAQDRGSERACVADRRVG